MKSQRKSQEKNQFQFFAGHGSHVFFQDRKGALWACGRNSSGQLSLGHVRGVSTPKTVHFFQRKTRKEIVMVAVGKRHSLFLTRLCGAYSCGANERNQLGNPKLARTKTNKDAAGVVFASEKSVRLSEVVAGAECSFFVTERRGEVFSCGGGSWRQAGHGEKSVERATKIPKLANIVQIVTGNRFAVFRAKDSRIFCCGDNSWGQLTRADEFNVPSRGNVAEITYFRKELHNTRIQHLIASHSTVYFVAEGPEKLVYCTGYASCGEFGNGWKEGKNTTPRKSSPLCGFDIFCTGNTNSFILYKKNGKVYGNGFQSLSYGYCSPDGRPTGIQFTSLEITSLSGINVSQLVTGYDNSYALCPDGSVYCTGRGADGQLLNGKLEDSYVFQLLNGKLSLRRKSEVMEKHEKKERIQFMVERNNIYCHIVTLAL